MNIREQKKKLTPGIYLCACEKNETTGYMYTLIWLDPTEHTQWQEATTSFPGELTDWLDFSHKHELKFKIIWQTREKKTNEHENALLFLQTDWKMRSVLRKKRCWSLAIQPRRQWKKKDEFNYCSIENKVKSPDQD